MKKEIKNTLKSYFEDESKVNPQGTPNSETGYGERDLNWMKLNLMPYVNN
jgi:hypothetical protein